MTTEKIQNQLKEFFWKDENQKIRVSLGNHRLDFKKDYYFDKFTKKGVKLYWINGGEKVFVMGKVEYNEDYNDYAFFTEGWGFIEHFGREKRTNIKEFKEISNKLLNTIDEVLGVEK